jgi:hypothetical protein
MKVGSWRVHVFRGLLPNNISSVEGPTLQFAVDGRHFKGHVRVQLDEGADLYNIHYGNLESRYKDKWKNISSTKGVFAEDITDVIDQVVEYMPLYKKN